MQKPQKFVRIESQRHTLAQDPSKAASEQDDTSANTNIQPRRLLAYLSAQYFFSFILRKNPFFHFFHDVGKNEKKDP